DDLAMLWNLVKERFSSTEPTDDKERTLWDELKREQNGYFHAGRERTSIVKRGFDFDVGYQAVSGSTIRDEKCAFKENLLINKQTKTLKCLEASSQHIWFNLKKIIDLGVNHKFRGGLLGIKLITLSTAKGRVYTVKLNWYCQS
nr:hypothetical protein [Tanacetum cinerariifolium]